MTVRRVEIDRLELRLADGAWKGVDTSSTALRAMGHAVAAQLAARLDTSAVEGSLPRRIEVSVPGRTADPGSIATAIDRRIRSPRVAVFKRGK
jgi:hypothetical protein